jgi:hypothetical protein
MRCFVLGARRDGVMPFEIFTDGGVEAQLAQARLLSELGPRQMTVRRERFTSWSYIVDELFGPVGEVR